MRFPTHGRAALIACAAIATLPIHGAYAQLAPQSDTLRVSPSMFSAEGGPTSVGARWLARKVIGGRLQGERLPRIVNGLLETHGAAALDPDANAELLGALADVGMFISLYAPGRDVDPDPDAPPVGGFNYGAVRVAFRAELESDQQLDHVRSLFGGGLRYTFSQAGMLRSLVPSFFVGYSAAVPLKSPSVGGVELDDEAHSRFDANVVWRLPVWTAPFVVHADLRYWSANGADPGLVATGADEGMSRAFTLAAQTRWRIRQIEIPEVFLRWSGGEQPILLEHRKAWTLGVVTARVMPGRAPE